MSRPIDPEIKTGIWQFVGIIIALIALSLLFHAVFEALVENATNIVLDTIEAREEAE